MDAGTGRVAGAEEEHVEEKDGVIVEEMSEGRLCQVQGYGGGVGYAANVGDAVNVSDDLLESQIPGRVDNLGELGLGDGHMPAPDYGRVGVMGEQLHVERVGFVFVCVEWDSQRMQNRLKWVCGARGAYQRGSCTPHSCSDPP
jgi:hypothetical protein